MKRKYIILIVMVFLVLGCASKYSEPEDNNPPRKPVLIPHLGDTGDVDSEGEPLTVSSGVYLDESNNGIDAISSSDGIRVLWEHLMYDNDLESVYVWRIRDNDVENPVNVAVLPPNKDYYEDKDISHNDIYGNTKFSYYLQVLDSHGNETLSDTVSYKLSYKSTNLEPKNNAEISYTSPVKFKWASSSAMHIKRLLLFDEWGDLVWSDESYSHANVDSLSYSGGGHLARGQYIWRVDVLIYDDEMGFNYGSESQETIFTIK